MKLHPLTQALVEEQKRLKLKEGKMTGPMMAEKLGVSSCFYSLLINGHKQPGQKVITGAIRSFKRINVTNLLRDVQGES